MPSADPPFRFESALTELETLVQRLEQGELSLEESLALFERGVALTHACRSALDAAEQKVQILLGEEPQAELAPFEADDAAD